MAVTTTKLRATCRCGEVVYELSGAPIASASCYCTSCQTAARQLAELPEAVPITEADGGTPVILHRKDRVTCLQGGDRLQDYRLKPTSPTRRVVASCCNTPMFLDFTKGFWLTLYRDRLPNGVAPLQFRVMTSERPAGVTLPDDVPNYASHSAKVMWKLLRTWLLMGFKTPKLTP